MFEVNVNKDMKKKNLNLQVKWNPYFTRREVRVGKLASCLCLTIIVKELKISVEQGRVAITLNIIKHQMFFLV